MIRRGVDYSNPAADWPAFARALVSSGRTFVGRYLPYTLEYAPHDPRCLLTVREAEALAADGIDVFCWWENSPTHAGTRTERRATEGRSAGEEDAILAQAMMQYFGQPEAPIFFTVDADVDAPSVGPYFEGALSVVGFDRMGSYGGYRVTKWLLDHGLVKYACQTEAWSRLLPDGRMSSKGVLTWDPRAQLRQWTVTRPGYPGLIGGIDCDGLDAMAEDFGQWRYGQTRPEEGDDMIDRDREALYRSTVRTLGTNYDVAYLKAKEQGATPEQLAAIEEERDKAIAHEREWLDPEHRLWPEPKKIASTTHL
jgi:hypothetical protein